MDWKLSTTAHDCRLILLDKLFCRSLSAKIGDIGVVTSTALKAECGIAAYRALLLGEKISLYITISI